MSMWDIFRRQRKISLDDPVFGHIEFESHHGVESWCHIPSDPGGHMVIISAPMEGPTQAQRDFYFALREDLISRLLECKAFIKQHEGTPANLSEMNVYAVVIGAEDELRNGEFVIELSDEDASDIHRVEFKSGKPEYYGVDD